MELSRPLIPCARCLTDVSSAAGETARCEKCQTPLLETVRRWARFVERDARLLSFALLAIALCLGVSIVATLGMSVGALWVDPKAAQDMVRTGVSPFVVAIGLVGMVAGCVQILSYLGWIIILAISFGSVFARATVPLLVTGGWSVLFLAISMVVGIGVATSNLNNPAEAQKSMMVFSTVGGGVTGVVTTIGIVWILSALQRSFTSDRRGMTLLVTAAVVAAIMLILSVGAAVVGTGRPIDSVGWASILMGSGAAQAAFQLLVVLRLLAIRSLALARARDVADISYGVATVSSGALVPPRIRT